VFDSLNVTLLIVTQGPQPSECALMSDSCQTQVLILDYKFSYM